MISSPVAMPRLPRYVLPGHPQHVIQRGNNRAPIFGTTEDYRYYFEKLVSACRRFDCEVHAYVLMTNHVHLLMTPHAKNGMGRVMQSLGRYYVRYFNDTYHRTGTLWEGRYKASPIDSENYLLTCMRYIELNPVRAAMVEHPAEYPYSSYRFNAVGSKDELVTTHEIYNRLADTPSVRQKMYRNLFSSCISDTTLEEIRGAAQKEWVLGSDRFKMEIEQITHRQASPISRGGDHKSSDYLSKKINRH